VTEASRLWPSGVDIVWVDVCALEAITPDTGVCALVGGVQVAIFRLWTGEVRALDNVDPFSGVAALARGILGDRTGEPVVASPIYKQAFALGSGHCLDDPGVKVAVYAVRVEDATVQVAVDAASHVPLGGDGACGDRQT
jgi:nitrite reductase (NADH) small subunit